VAACGSADADDTVGTAQAPLDWTGDDGFKLKEKGGSLETAGIVKVLTYWRGADALEGDLRSADVADGHVNGAVPLVLPNATREAPDGVVAATGSCRLWRTGALVGVEVVVVATKPALLVSWGDGSLDMGVGNTAVLNCITS
jgi:hypothetical protein